MFFKLCYTINSQRKSKSKKEVKDMKMSDVIEEFIKDLFDDEQDYVEIQRNELAEKFNCVPSQINYVISTRFRPSQGYYVESRRGGGGHIRIKKINITNIYKNHKKKSKIRKKVLCKIYKVMI